MRRTDREITDSNEIITIMRKCDVCRLALHDEPVPYLVPVNFGLEAADGQLVLYFHGAGAGKKLDLIARDPRAAFEMDCSHRLVLDGETGNCTMEYESVVGSGVIDVLPEAEKPHALACLMAHYRAPDFPYNPSVIPQTTLLRLTVQTLTGKRRKRRA